MNQEPNTEAAETVQTTNVPAVDLPRLVLPSSELLENLEEWGEHFREKQHGVTLTILRARKTICDQSARIAWLENQWEETKELLHAVGAGWVDSRLKRNVEEALMHLETNYDIDGASMKDSDAARKLRSAISLENASAMAPATLGPEITRDVMAG